MNLFLIEKDFFRSLSFGNEKILSCADSVTIGKTEFDILALNDKSILQKILDDAEIGTLESLRLHNSSDTGEGKIFSNGRSKRHNLIDQVIIMIEIITDDRRILIKP